MATAVLVATPVISIIALALQAAQIWPHLIANVIPPALLDTALLLGGSGAALLIGAATAWLVSQHEFPGRALFEWLLPLPLAIPTYITAYVYVELLGARPVQRALRAVAGAARGDTGFPDLRSLPARSS